MTNFPAKTNAFLRVSTGVILLLAPAARADTVADLKEALRLLDKLDTAGAEKRISTAIEAEPKVAALFVARAHLREHRGDLVAAGRDALRASQLGEDLWQWASTMLLEGRMYDAAAVAFEGAWKAHGELANLEAAATSRASAAEYKDAIRLYEELIQKAGAGNRAGYRMAIGNARSLTGAHAAALKDLDAAIKEDPRLVRAYQLRGRVKLRTGRVKEGIVDLVAAQKLKPNSNTAHRSLGLAYFDTGNYADAIKHLEMAARNSSIYTHLYLYLARSRTGVPVDRLRALKSLRAAVESYPEDGSWSLALGDFLLGDLSEKDLLARANKSTKFVRLQQLCEAYGYIGQQARIAGNDKKATESFKACVATNVGSYMEFASADMDLRRTGNR